jgi:uncharacterized protein (DUF1778 family)
MKQRPKRKTLSIRLSEREQELAAKAALIQGCSFAEFCRMAVVGSAMVFLTQQEVMPDEAS